MRWSKTRERGIDMAEDLLSRLNELRGLIRSLRQGKAVDGFVAACDRALATVDDACEALQYEETKP